jgi:hypothetical protein
MRSKATADGPDKCDPVSIGAERGVVYATSSSVLRYGTAKGPSGT